MSEPERKKSFLEAEAAVHQLAGELTQTQRTRLEVESLVSLLKQLRESLGACQGTLDRAHDQFAAAQRTLLESADLLRDATQRIDTLGRRSSGLWRTSRTPFTPVAKRRARRRTTWRPASTPASGASSQQTASWQWPCC